MTSEDASRAAAGHFAALRDEQFVVLTTYRRSGEAVPTTVWFAEHAGKLYITTRDQSGKAKRVRATARVQVTPSDRVGNIHGDAIEGHARLLTPAEHDTAIAALRQKYRDQYDQITAQTQASQPDTSRVFLEIAPPQ